MGQTKNFLNNIQKGTILWAATFLLLFLVASALFFRFVEQYGFRIERQNFLARVRILAAAVYHEYIPLLKGSDEDLTSPYYLEIKEQLKNVVRSDPRLKFAYLMALKEG